MEAVKEAGKTEIVFFARSGYAQPEPPRCFGLVTSWSRGQDTTVLKPRLQGLFRVASLVTANHSDIGGYTTIPVPWFIPVSHYYEAKG